MADPAERPYSFAELPLESQREAKRQEADFQIAYGAAPHELLYRFLVFPNEQSWAILRQRLGPELDELVADPEILVLARNLHRDRDVLPIMGEEGLDRAIAATLLGWDVPVFQPIPAMTPTYLPPHLEGTRPPTDIKALLDKLGDDWEDRGVGIDAYLDLPGKRIELNSLVVKKELRGKGLGSAFMKDLVKLADRFGLTITLTPSTDWGASSVERLRRFYRRFGFVSNKGRNKIWQISDSMYRLPHHQTTSFPKSSRP